MKYLKYPSLVINKKKKFQNPGVLFKMKVSSLVSFASVAAMSCCCLFSSLLHASEFTDASQSDSSPASKSVAVSITLVTGNMKKLEEVKKVVEGTGVEITNENIDLPELQAATSREIAIAKSKEAYNNIKIPGPVLIEDTSLGFDAMGGLPGPYIKWFQDNEQVGSAGLAKMLWPYENKGAVATTLFVYYNGTDEPLVFEGCLHGTVPETPQGDSDFGWDNIFIPDGYDMTFAEMSSGIKNGISQRKLALDKFVEYIKTKTTIQA